MIELTLIVRKSGELLHFVHAVLSERHFSGIAGTMLASITGGGTEAPRTDTPPGSIAEQIDAWLTSLETTVPDAGDRARYRREVERLVRACSIGRASDATFERLVAYMAERRGMNLKGGKPLRGKTYNAVLSKVRSFFDFAKRAGWCSANPTEGIAWANEQDSEEGSRAFTAAELAAVLTVAGTPNPGDKRRTTDRYYAYLVATATPLRRSTIARLQWPMFRTWVARFGDQAYPAGELRLPRKAVKKSKRVQVLPLPRWAVEALIEWWEVCGSPKDGPVFPRISEHRTLLDDCAAVGIPRYTEEGGIGWNSFRKFYLTDMATRTMPAVLNELSGHQDIRTTLKFYVGQTREQAAAAVAEIENPSIVGKFPRGGAKGQNRWGKGIIPNVDKSKEPPFPHGANLTRGVARPQDVPSHPERLPLAAEHRTNTIQGPAAQETREGEISAANEGRAFSDHCASESDPMGIRTPMGIHLGDADRQPNYRLLAIELARGLRQVAGAVVQALDLEESDHAGTQSAT